MKSQHIRSLLHISHLFSPKMDIIWVVKSTISKLARETPLKNDSLSLERFYVMNCYVMYRLRRSSMCNCIRKQRELSLISSHNKGRNSLFSLIEHNVVIFHTQKSQNILFSFTNLNIYTQIQLA